MVLAWYYCRISSTGYCKHCLQRPVTEWGRTFPFSLTPCKREVLLSYFVISPEVPVFKILRKVLYSFFFTKMCETGHPETKPRLLLTPNRGTWQRAFRERSTGNVIFSESTFHSKFGRNTRHCVYVPKLVFITKHSFGSIRSRTSSQTGVGGPFPAQFFRETHCMSTTGQNSELKKSTIRRR